MRTQDKIRLLEAQITKMDDLEKAENYYAYKAWHQETGLLLEEILGPGAKPLNEFRLYSGRSQVITDDDATNARYDTESYFTSIKHNRSLLNGVASYLHSTQGIESSNVASAARPKRGGLSAWLNNPWIVTILGGLILALILAYFKLG